MYIIILKSLILLGFRLFFLSVLSLLWIIQAKIIGNDNLQFNITLDEQQMMVKQVTFKFNLMQASPPPTKTNQDINKQVDDEIARYKLAMQTNPITFRIVGNSN